MSDEEKVWSPGFNKLIMTMETVLRSSNIYCGAIHGQVSLPGSLQACSANSLLTLFNMVVHFAGMKTPEHPKVIHDASIMNRLKAGWSLGDVYDKENKKSPLMTVYEDTPPHYQDELKLIAAVSQTLLADENQEELINEFRQYFEMITSKDENNESIPNSDTDADQGVD